MKLQNLSDCDVLFLGRSYDSYRVVNQALRPLGLSVMWATEVEPARFLSQTTRISVLLCDARTATDEVRDFLYGDDTLPGIAGRLLLTLPILSSDPQDLEKNMYAYKRLLRAVTNQLHDRNRDHDSLPPSGERTVHCPAPTNFIAG